MFMTVSLTSFIISNYCIKLRAGHSCETALVHMIDSWLHAIDNDQLIGVILADFKKAFDTVDHQILFVKT